MKVRKFRILRLRHHVSMVELGRACGVSAQRISELELSENKPSAMVKTWLTCCGCTWREISLTIADWFGSPRAE
mgnify:CR=1 FL=1